MTIQPFSQLSVRPITYFVDQNVPEGSRVTIRVGDESVCRRDVVRLGMGHEIASGNTGDFGVGNERCRVEEGE